ncbi:PAS domain-containing sensor histidine kinase [Tateyamaria omphalii]|uniref:sensor histidine kinase n=1 Tax=Tateyamaria omphalii TaxID=299262 RepID=UPI001C99D2AF|nr:PAS domain-containing sensor histidine kinase [Tateyamaria omphalii]MBY5934689.1 PAS domain-containing sensor histidine kinase [Tateyamaria omphalii]
MQGSKRLDYSIYDMVDTPVFVLVADEDDRPIFDFMNRSGCILLGLDLTDIVGKAVHDILNGRAAYAVYRQQLKAWKGGRTAEFETGLPLGDRIMWFRTCLIASHDDEGTLVRMVGTSHDISAERALEQQETMTVAAMREVEDLVCLAAHDLRSPISNLKSLAYLMRNDFVDHGDGKVELIDMIDELADKSLGIISETMSQVMAKSAPACLRPVNLGAMCDDIVVLLDPLREHSIAYPRTTVEADFTAVQIILRNLIDNALKHSGAASVRVDVAVAAVNARRLVVSVRDHGRGFDLDEGGRVDGMPSEGGYGLQGVIRLVKARGGSVAVEKPADGLGAEIRVELPGRILEGSDEQARAG